MASIVKYFPLVFLLFLTAASLRVHARESQFFSKAVRYEPSSKETATVPEETPDVKKEDPETMYPQSHNGYGLYGHGSEEFTPTTSTTYNTDSNSNDGEPSKFPTNTVFASESYENQNYNNRYDNKDARYTTDNVPSKSSNEEFSSGSYRNTNYPGVYPKEQQGMSDTRFLENGKYFYDVNGEKYPNRYDPTSENSEKYSGYNGYGYGGYSYGSNGNRYEYNNAKEGYQNNQEEYVP